MKKFIFGLLVSVCCHDAIAELRAVAFPKTVEDVPFQERIENTQIGYEPYKDLQVYHPLEISKKTADNHTGHTNGGNSDSVSGGGDSGEQIVGGNENSWYYIVQCRTTFPHVRKYMESYRNSPLPMNTVLTQDEYLECSDEYHSSINKCFTPCDTSISTVGRINQELSDVIPPFCSGNGVDSEKRSVLAFSDPSNNRIPKIYTKAEADAVLAKINGYYNECGTNGRRWYWYLFVFESQNSGQSVILYDYKTIGK